MDEQRLAQRLRALSQTELFYRDYRLAKSSPAGFQVYLEQLNPSFVRASGLVIPEWPDTAARERPEEQYFPPDGRAGLRVRKHECFSPAVAHSHDYFEMLYVWEGRCVCEVRAHSSVLSGGDVCLLQPGVVHSLDVSDESVVIVAHIRRSAFRQHFFGLLQGGHLLANFFISSLYSAQGIDTLVFHTGADPELQKTMIALWGEFYEQQDYYQELANALATRVFVLLLRKHMDSCVLPGGRVKDTEAALRIFRFLQINAATATLGDLAAEFHYSPEYASRQIKRITGRTFMQLLTSIRLENAEQLLRDTALPVSEIAAAVGYESSEHFIRTFRKHRNMTPSIFRQQKRITAFPAI